MAMNKKLDVIKVWIQVREGINADEVVRKHGLEITGVDNDFVCVLIPSEFPDDDFSQLTEELQKERYNA